MPEDLSRQFMLPNLTTPVLVMLRKVLENDTTTKDKIFLNGLGMKKGKSIGTSIMLKTVMEVAQYYNFFNYRNPIPQKYLKSQDRTIVAGPGMNLAPKFVLSGHSKEKVGKETPPYELIIDNLETSLATTVDYARGKTSGAIVDSFIKPRASTMFGHP